MPDSWAWDFLLPMLAGGWRAWLIAGFLLLMAEGLNPGTFALFFCGFGALATAGLCFLLPGLDPAAQLLSFAAMSLLSLAFLRPRLARAFLKDAPGPVPGDGGVGRALSGFGASPEGTVQFQGTEWRAATRDRRPAAIAPGDPVAVTGRDGLTLFVAPLDGTGDKTGGGFGGRL